MLNISIIPNMIKDTELAVTKKLISLLESKANIYISGDAELAAHFDNYTNSVYDGSDVAVVIGGDGTIIKASVSCARKKIPMLGINLGKVGFMSEVEVCDMETAAQKLISGDYTVENRMMMDVTINKADGRCLMYNALNDVVTEKSEGCKLIEMELLSGDEKISQYTADGLIISTPTGSTGYNLSAGGPVINPKMNVFFFFFICPHMLTARPAVIPADVPVTVSPVGPMSNNAVVAVDGEPVCSLKNGESVKIVKSDYCTRLIKIFKRSFYDTLIHKLS